MPSTATMISPFRKPALSAADPSAIAATRSSSSCRIYLRRQNTIIPQRCTGPMSPSLPSWIRAVETMCAAIGPAVELTVTADALLAAKF